MTTLDILGVVLPGLKMVSFYQPKHRNHQSPDADLSPSGVDGGVLAGLPLGALEAVDGGADVARPRPLLQGAAEGEVAVGVRGVQLRSLVVGQVLQSGEDISKYPRDRLLTF